MPDLRIVSEQSTKDIELNRRRERLTFALRELAANVLRVVRGAGKAYDLLPQMVRCIEAAESYREVAGFYPSDYEISDALTFEGEVDALYERASEASLKRWQEDGTIDEAYAEKDICRGALQFVASSLLEQRIQRSAGRSELMAGVRALEAARERYRQAHHLPLTKAKKNRKKRRSKPSDIVL